MKVKGFLVSNDINSDRVKALVKNVELRNYNAVVTNDSHRIYQKIQTLFRKVLVDAPCSGEGMFRRTKAAKAGENINVTFVAVCKGNFSICR